MVWKIYAPPFRRSLNLVHEYTFKNNLHKSTIYVQERIISYTHL